jgi:hypothetical protein
MNSTHLHKLMKKTNAAPSFSPRLHGRLEKAEHTATPTTVHAPATTAGQVDSIFSSTDLRRAPRPFIDGGAAAAATGSDHQSNTQATGPSSRAQISAKKLTTTPSRRRRRGLPTYKDLT